MVPGWYQGASSKVPGYGVSKAPFSPLRILILIRWALGQVIELGFDSRGLLLARAGIQILMDGNSEFSCRFKGRPKVRCPPEDTLRPTRRTKWSSSILHAPTCS